MVDPADLYDGLDPSVVEFPRASSRFDFIDTPDKPKDARLRRDYVATINAALDILGARLLALIAVVAACGMWGWAVFDPNNVRTLAAACFSVTVLLPTIALAWRRG
jgi:hypothetical protein